MAPTTDRDSTKHDHPIQPPNEWSVEQGMPGALSQILDQTGDDPDDHPEHDGVANAEYDKTVVDTVDHDLESVKHIDLEDINPHETFAQEKEGWHGYIEWENCPEKRAIAHKILLANEFPDPPDFQLGPIPGTNPVLEGVRWKQWHKAVGGHLTNVPEESWEIVQKEKHPDMLHLLEFPYNGESPKRLTTAKVITPNPLHFVRNHGGIPDIDPSKWHLELGGLVAQPKVLTLADLQNESLFPRVEKLVTIQCSGTRRIEQINLYPGEGDEMINAPWAEGAIGTALWTGVTLKSVLEHCGGLVDGGKHLELVGADTYFKQHRVMNYAVSVPLSKVNLDEVILAWEMNGEPLPKIHGAPVRAVVLGYIGARSVKWLYRINALKAPTMAPVQSREYLYFNQQVGKHNQRWTDGIQIQEMPVSSAIMSPLTKQIVIHNGKIKVKGWAYSGGGRWPERVELSADGGFSWYACPPENMSKKYKYAWRTWHMDLPCDVEGWIEIVVRTWDNSLNTQPLEVRSAWNWGLHVTSSAHRIKIYSVNKTREQTRRRLKDFEQRGQSFAPITKPTEFPYQDLDEYAQFFKRNGPRDVDE